jgi:hypothetical protein
MFQFNVGFDSQRAGVVLQLPVPQVAVRGEK